MEVSLETPAPATTPPPAAAEQAAPPAPAAPTPPPPPATPPAPTEPPAPAAPAAPTATFNPDGTLGEGWHTALGDEFAPHAETAARFKSVADIFKSYVHLRGTGPAYPGETATQDEVDRFRTLANVPASPEGYNLPIPEDLPEGVTFNQELAGEFAAVAHKHHVPAPALQALMAKQLEVETAAATAAQLEQAAQAQQAQDALVAEWRGDFQKNASTVRHLTSLFGSNAGIEQEEISALAQNPTFARIMLQVSRHVGEDSVAAPAGLGDLRSPAERADAIMNGTDPVWGQKYIQGDPSAYQAVVKLQQQVHN